MTSAAGRACRNVALVVAALVSVALCGGCMGDAARLRVDAISRWHADHATPLRVFVESQAKASVVGARAHMRDALEATKIELAIDLHELALDERAACERRHDAAKVRDREKIREFRGQLSQAEEDRMNRVGDRAAAFTIVHKYATAQERYWEAVLRARGECESEVRSDLVDRLDQLNEKFDKVMHRTSARLSRTLRWHWWSCERAAKRALSDAAGHVDALAKCKSWKPSDCVAPAVTSAGRADAPLNVCLAAVRRAQVRLDQAIAQGRRDLEQYVRGLASRRPINSEDGARARPYLAQGGD